MLNHGSKAKGGRRRNPWGKTWGRQKRGRRPMAHATEQEDDSPIDADKLRNILATRVGSCILRKERLDMRFVDFKEEVGKRLHGTEMEHFTHLPVQDFVAVVKNQTQSLVESGHMPWTKKRFHDVPYMCEMVSVPMNTLDDHWEYPLQGRLRTLAASQNMISRYPWEIVMFEDRKPIPGLPEAIRIDWEELVDAENSRKAVLQIFKKFPARIFRR